MLPILISLLLPNASPAPLPTLPPEITRTTTSAQCNTLHDVTLPVGVVIRANDRAFKAMAVSTQKFMSHFMPGDAPTAADFQASLGNQGQPAANSNGTGTALSTSLSASGGDDDLLYGPGQILNAARIDSVAQQIYENLTLERKYLKDSYKRLPEGKDPKADALRAHAQNMIDLQQALADRYDQFASTFIGNMGVAEMTRNDQNDSATFKMALRGLLLGDTQSLQATSGEAKQNDPMFGYESMNDLAKGGSNGEVVQALRRQEFEYTSSLVQTYNQCNGTNYSLKPITATPLPDPTHAP
jgi:hypothetical protein